MTKPFFGQHPLTRILLAVGAIIFFLIVLVTVFLSFSQTNSQTKTSATGPKVVVTIAPLHALASAVMEGVGTPHLLMPPTSSPHGYALRPSDARALQEADLIVWVGESLETALAKPLKLLNSSETGILKITGLKGLTLYPVRVTLDLDAQEDDHDDHDDSHDDHDHGMSGSGDVIDPHVWLDPLNAIVITRALADRLAMLDPKNGDRYQSNASELINRLERLNENLTTQLKPLAGRPYVVFHDGYQYFDTRYGLSLAGVLTLHPETPLSVARTASIRSILRMENTACLFTEPQFSQDMIDSITEGTGARVAVLDPLGATIPPGPTAYEATIQAIGDAFTNCLSKPGQ